jgi:hypothetical protein
MKKRIVPALIVLALVALLLYQLIGQGATECKVCVTFKTSRQCATAVAATEAEAREEAHRSACSRIASGVTDSFACPKVPADAVTCTAK